MKVFPLALRRLAGKPLNWIMVAVFPLIILLAVAATLRPAGGDANGAYNSIKLGICDLDNSVLSGTLVKQMESRYNCIQVEQGDTSPLTEQTAQYVLTIPAGYQDALLRGDAPQLEGMSLKLSDVQYLASASAESVTRALLMMSAGASEAELPGLVDEWERASAVVTETVDVPTQWVSVLTWLNFYGWISMLTGLFLVKTIMDDRLGGLPERVGVLPVSRRRYLLQCIIAVVLVGELSVVELLVGLELVLGQPLPNMPHMILLLTLYNLFAVGLSVGLYSVIKSAGSVTMAVVMASTLLAMLGGTYWPVSAMPEFMQKVAYFSPNYWLGEGLEHIETITPETYWLPIVLLLCFSVVVYLLGSWRRVQRAEE